MADELLPSQAVALGNVDVRGIVTQAGSQTSHAAIIARSRGIPAISGMRGILRHVKTGDTMVVDGRGGHVLVNPDAEQRSAYLKLEREFFLLKDQLATNRDLPALTADGASLELLANINSAADAKAAVGMGASGVGLFRTEYIYLTHPDVPDEEEQFIAYRDVIEASPEPQRHDPHARYRRRQDRSLPGPHASGSQPLHGLAEHPPLVRASRVLRHAAPGHPAGGGRCRASTAAACG